VKTFLNMARVRPSRRRPVQLNDIARSVVDMMQYTCRTHGVRLQLDLAPDERLSDVVADEDQLTQVLVNLVVNAQQALENTNGTRVVRIRTDADPSASTARLEVRDNGPGIPREIRPQLFEPFITSKAEGEGTGLGLAVSRSLARANGGDLVLIDEEPGMRGAAFRLELPVGRDDALSRAVPRPARGLLPAHRRERLLVIDDEPELAAVMGDALTTAGFSVLMADSAVAALELLRTQTFDAIVSDFRMPDVDGASLWRALKRHHPNLADRVLFVTGDTLSPHVKEFLQVSRSHYIDKPFGPANLVDAVLNLLRARSQH
jgi:two-component system NtrC family sensor kinase